MTTTTELQAAKIENLVNTKGAQVEEYKDLKICTYVNNVRGEDKPCLQIFRGRSAKATAHYFYNTEEAREQSIAGYKRMADNRAEYKAERAALKANFVPKSDVGVIFHCSWGYDQTNNNFYEIVEKTSKHFAMVREIAQDMVQTGFMCGNVTCKPGDFIGEAFKVKLQQNGSGEYIRINDHRSAYVIEDVTKSFYDSSYA